MGKKGILEANAIAYRAGDNEEVNNANQIKAKTVQKVKGDDVNLTNINQQSIYNFNKSDPIGSYMFLMQKI